MPHVFFWTKIVSYLTKNMLNFNMFNQKMDLGVQFVHTEASGYMYSILKLFVTMSCKNKVFLYADGI